MSCRNWLLVLVSTVALGTGCSTPDAVTGSSTTVGMAVFRGAGPGRPDQPDGPPCRVYHGPAFRLVVDLADPQHCQFVIAGGNGGRPDSPFIADHYPTWLRGGYFTVSLRRDEIDVYGRWQIEPQTQPV